MPGKYLEEKKIAAVGSVHIFTMPHISIVPAAAQAVDAEPTSATASLSPPSELTQATPEPALRTAQPASTPYVRITSSLRSKVRALRQHAAWSFRRIAGEVGIAVSTVFSICKAPSTPKKMKPGPLKLLNSPIRKQLVALATSSQQNRRLPLAEVAKLAEIQASPTLLREAFAQEGYHRRVAQARPYLSASTKEARLDWAYHYADWTRADWNKVIGVPKGFSLL